jgi:hypothetical protein
VIVVPVGVETAGQHLVFAEFAIGPPAHVTVYVEQSSLVKLVIVVPEGRPAGVVEQHRVLDGFASVPPEHDTV